MASHGGLRSGLRLDSNDRFHASLMAVRWLVVIRVRVGMLCILLYITRIMGVYPYL